MDSIHDAYVEALIKRMSEIKVGHALEEGIFMGPVDGVQLEANLGWVEKARRTGAELAFGGEQLALKHQGHYMAPTLHKHPKSLGYQPRRNLRSFGKCYTSEDLDEAIQVTNDTRFGLTGGIITQSLKTSTIFKQQSQTGCVMVNLPAGTDYVPFGGRKESSFGPVSKVNMLRNSTLL